MKFLNLIKTTVFSFFISQVLANDCDEIKSYGAKNGYTNELNFRYKCNDSGKLTEFLLNSEGIETFPEVLLKYKTLENINLSSNKITSVPKELGELTKLQVLEIANNRLTDFPDILSKLTNIKNLDLSHNKLTVFPKNLSKLKKLRTLFLYNNEISDAIPDLNNIDTLDYLDFSENKKLTGETLTNENIAYCNYYGANNDEICMPKKIRCFGEVFVMDSCGEECGRFIIPEYKTCSGSRKTTTTTDNIEPTTEITTEVTTEEIIEETTEPTTEIATETATETETETATETAVPTNSSTSGKCGKEYGKCQKGQCCSKYGYCGETSAYCGTGCQSDFGKCN